MFHFPCNSQRWKYVISSGNFYLTSRMWPFAHFPSLRFKKSIIEKLNNFSFVLCKNWIVWPRLWCTTACWISIAFFLRHRVYIWQISMKKTFIASRPTIYSSWQFKARGAGISIIGGGQIFIYSCSAQLISFEIDCFYSLWTRIYEYLPRNYRYSGASVQRLLEFTSYTKVLPIKCL
jgi:hypothetical protein